MHVALLQRWSACYQAHRHYQELVPLLEPLPPFLGILQVQWHMCIDMQFSTYKYMYMYVHVCTHVPHYHCVWNVYNVCVWFIHVHLGNSCIYMYMKQSGVIHLYVYVCVCWRSSASSAALYARWDHAILYGGHHQDTQRCSVLWPKERSGNGAATGSAAVPVAQRGGDICQSHYYCTETTKILFPWIFWICDSYPFMYCLIGCGIFNEP